MKRSLGLSFLLVGAIAAVACTPAEEGECVLDTPDTWDGSKRDENAATALALRAQLDALAVSAMRAAEDGSGTISSVTELNGLFEAGDPSLKDITNEAWQDIIQDVFEEFAAVIAAGPQDLVDDTGAFTPGEAGGVYGDSSRGINAGGIEVRQLADKGLFAGGALYPYALSLTEGEISEATIDQLSVLFGTNADLDRTGELTDSANYAHRMGYHDVIGEALTRARGYAAEPSCAKERDEAVVDFFRLWEESMFARFVYYANAGASRAALAVEDDDYAEALHQLAEGIGLGLGFYGVADPKSGPLAGKGRVASDERILEMMDSVGVDVNALKSSTTGELVTEAADFGAAVNDLEAIVGEALGLKANEVAAWRSPLDG